MIYWPLGTALFEVTDHHEIKSEPASVGLSEKPCGHTRKVNPNTSGDIDVSGCVPQPNRLMSH